MPNANLSRAKNAKNDEFYTQWHDIEREVNAYLEFDPGIFRDKTILCPCDDPYESKFFKYFALHFNDFGLKKLIATCHKDFPIANTYLSLFADESEEEGTAKKPHVIEVTESPDMNNGGAADSVDIELLLASSGNHLTRLKGNGDFRSEEVKRLRDGADFIITNPPFSLFREFLAWIMKAKKQFLVITNMNAVTYKEVFPLIKENKIWLGVSNGAKEYVKPDGTMQKMGNTCWFTNLEHGRRHQPLTLMTLEDNLKYSRHKEIRGKTAYDRYDNYDAIEVPFTDAIPDDYGGIMGVPISFLDKYCPEQFEILGATQRGCHDEVPDTRKYDDYWEVKPDGTPTGSSGGKTNENANLLQNDGKKNYFINKEGRIIQSAYQRIFIKKKA